MLATNVESDQQPSDPSTLRKKKGRGRGKRRRLMKLSGNLQTHHDAPLEVGSTWQEVMSMRICLKDLHYMTASASGKESPSFLA